VRVINVREVPENDIRHEENALTQLFFMEIDFRIKNCQKMALKSIKRLILSIDGASTKLAS
jgi:hypothetical protein